MGRPADPSQWPDASAARTWFEHLSRVRADHGMPTEQIIANRMGLKARSRASALLRNALPKDEEQAEKLLKALKAWPGQMHYGIDLYRVITSNPHEASVIAPGRPLKAGKAFGKEDNLDASSPVFPGQPMQPSHLGGTEPRLPGALPPVWGNVPARNPGFTGRDQMLTDVRAALLDGGRAVVQALAGMGGVGKTQLAAEYAHRFASDYDIVWWIAAEQASLLGEQVATLAEELGCSELGAGLLKTRWAVLRELRGRDRWLLVFDNAEDPEDIAPWLPGGAGHVLITSRAHQWTEIAVPVEIDVLARGESVAMLRNRVLGLAETDADQVAEVLGDLPLAIAQAASYLAETGTPAGQYADLVGTRAAQLMQECRPSSYQDSLAAVTVLALERLRDDDPAAAELAKVFAFLAPEPVPIDWFPTAAARLAPVLAKRATNPVAWRQVLASLSRSALARVDTNGLVMHRLTQAILRTSLPQEADIVHALVQTIVVSNNPGDPDEPGNWPGWTRLLPHLLFFDLATTSNTDLRDLACHAATYLVGRGDPSAQGCGKVS